MAAYSSSFQISTKGFCDVHDITSSLERILRDSGLANGIITAFVPGSTAGLTTIEFESGAVEDFKQAVERMAPQGIRYHHDARSGDGNGFAHVRAAILGPSLTVPFASGSLQTGTWQQAVLVDFDNRARSRELLVTVVGD